ncbi:PREDICTED: serine protease gd-like [Vollenhovia emeryi]|uniref:serine protease gd-like n=1 Tax=Vollenhovia emeryi TaxID=411798 RepID=UPI0005F46F5D|nr:PREDICTED: serine protease gd-like [Vollenhovia emeryi]
MCNLRYMLLFISVSGKNIKANIELGHIVYPPNKEPLLQFQPWHRNSSNYRINNPNYNSNDECGVTDYYTDSINRQIPNGANTLPGQWPWVVPVYYIRKKEKDFITTYEFQCGGSILTNKHIITVAYCVFSEIDIQNPKYIQPNNLEVVFGQYNLFKLHGDGIVNIKVAFYILHPDFDYYLTSNLAILTLKKPVEYTPLTKPICLWSDYSSTTLEDVVGKTGYVVGWGQDPLGHRDFQEQRMIKVTIAGQENCLRSDNRYISYTSNRTFCANSLDEKNGLCDGDSGNALVLLNNHTGRYELRGLYSGGLASGNTTLLCDPRLYDIYVDVVHFKSWIQRQILT